MPSRQRAMLRTACRAMMTMPCHMIFAQQQPRLMPRYAAAAASAARVRHYLMTPDITPLLPAATPIVLHDAISFDFSLLQLMLPPLVFAAASC